MSKNKRLIISGILVLLMVASIIAGRYIEGLNCWFEPSCTTTDSGYWPNILQLYIPLALLAAVLLLNIFGRKSKK
jgi:hypothetical protein